MPSRAELKKNLRLLKERLRERPMDLDARMRIARTYRLLDELKDATAHYAATARYLSLAGHPLQAIAVLKELLQVNPKHEESLLFLAKLYARTRAADPSNRGRVAVPIIDDGDSIPGMNPLTDGVAMTTTGIWRAIKPVPVAELQKVKNVEDVDAIAEVDDDDIEPLEHSLSFEEAVLTKVPLFSSLDAASFVALSHSMVLVRHAAGEALFREGDTGESCFVLVKGSVSVRRGELSADDVRDVVGPGDIVGIFALAHEDKRQATVTALSAVESFEIDRLAVENIFRAHPQAKAAFDALLAERREIL